MQNTKNNKKEKEQSEGERVGLYPCAHFTRNSKRGEKERKAEAASTSIATPKPSKQFDFSDFQQFLQQQAS